MQFSANILPNNRLAHCHWEILDPSLVLRQTYVAVFSDYDRLDEDMAERMSAMKASGEDDMAFFERRYQERVTFFNVVRPTLFFMKQQIKFRF